MNDLKKLFRKYAMTDPGEQHKLVLWVALQTTADGYYSFDTIVHLMLGQDTPLDITKQFIIQWIKEDTIKVIK